MSADEQLEQVFEALEPGAAQRARMEAALEPVFFAPPMSLTAEWLELLRIRPLLHGTLALVGSALLWGASPAGAAVLALVRALR